MLDGGAYGQADEDPLSPPRLTSSVTRVVTNDAMRDHWSDLLPTLAFQRWKHTHTIQFGHETMGDEESDEERDEESGEESGEEEAEEEAGGFWDLSSVGDAVSTQPTPPQWPRAAASAPAPPPGVRAPTGNVPGTAGHARAAPVRVKYGADIHTLDQADQAFALERTVNSKLSKRIQQVRAMHAICVSP